MMSIAGIATKKALLFVVSCVQEFTTQDASSWNQNQRMSGFVLCAR